MKASLFFDDNGLGRETGPLDGRGHDLPGRAGDPLQVSPHDGVIAFRYRLFLRNNRWHVENAGRKTGTMLNGRSVGGAEALTDGDVIFCGDARVRFCCSCADLDCRLQAAPTAPWLEKVEASRIATNPIGEAIAAERERLSAQVALFKQALEQAHRMLGNDASRAQTAAKQRQLLVAQNQQLRFDLTETARREHERCEQVERLTRLLNAARRDKGAAEMALADMQRVITQLSLDVETEKRARKAAVQSNVGLREVIAKLQRGQDQGGPSSLLSVDRPANDNFDAASDA